MRVLLQLCVALTVIFYSGYRAWSSIDQQLMIQREQLHLIQVGVDKLNLPDGHCIDPNSFNVTDYGQLENGDIWLYGDMVIPEEPCGFRSLIAAAGNFYSDEPFTSIPQLVLSCGLYDYCDPDGQAIKRPPGKQKFGVWIVRGNREDVNHLRLIVIHDGLNRIQHTVLWEVTLPFSVGRHKEPPLPYYNHMLRNGRNRREKVP